MTNFGYQQVRLQRLLEGVDDPNAIPDHIGLPRPVWHIDAGRLTEAGDGLADLSGNGLDGFFASDPGADGPIALPHDGDDYLYLPPFDQAANLVEGNGAVLDGVSVDAATTDTRLEVDLVVDQVADQTILKYTGARPGVALSLDASNTMEINVGDVITTTFVPELGVRYLIWAVATTTRLELWVNQVLVWSQDGTYEYTGPSNRIQLGGGTLASRINNFQGRIYSARGYIDGEMVLDFDPANVSDDYFSVANPGTAGGSWALKRADASGCQTAIVNRPLVLLGKGGNANITVPGTWARTFHDSPHTLVMAYRQVIPDAAAGGGVMAWTTNYGGLSMIVRVNNNTWTLFTPEGNFAQSSHAPYDGGPLNIAVGFDGYRWFVNHRDDPRKYTLDARFGYGEAAADMWFGNNGWLEFLGAAVYDRALTEAETALAFDVVSDARGPHPQYALRTEVTPHIQTVGNGTDTSYVITHNLGTRAVTVTVRQTAAPYAELVVTNEATTTDTVTLTFGAPPTVDQYEVVVRS